jgi:hypothetical protein
MFGLRRLEADRYSDFGGAELNFNNRHSRPCCSDRGHA